MKKYIKGGIVLNLLFFLIFILLITYTYNKFGKLIYHIFLTKMALNKAKSLAEINGSDKQIRNLILHGVKKSPYKIDPQDIIIKRDENTTEIAVKINLEISTLFIKKKTFGFTLKEKVNY